MVIEREPLERSTDQLIADMDARRDALAQVEPVLKSTTGTAHDPQGTVQITVDGQGKLLKLYMRPDAVKWGADTLAKLIVDVARVAHQDATQNAYNKLGPLLGDNLTYAIEQLSGLRAPARQETEGGITAEEFQARRDERVRHESQGTQQVSPSSAADDDYDLDTFDASMLRSDR
ncbi:YbaB/EbfC DNA-binding family protein [Herbihabitans rhizosphaerae]|uniref:YbaB/EbfC DNA-binding family protein n=1 Tax=Herbihabitans rhizosphaerae TaxID=1872711 RepID=A0A4Q7KKV2_9PSEU|nr:YbaB/EbfC family nucleoid-associated protein [Herbihabitans rhizosphaerae]RZS36847.1 YbaB/EbfC DNA-binding family protein [Herbihabitans rhizosphaerae]